MNKWGMLSLLCVTLVVGATGYKLWVGEEKAQAVMTGDAKTDEQGAYREFWLEAGETPWQIKPGLDVLAWTYNGTVPGPQIRVKEGERVKIHLKNTFLPDPVTIHWHGYPVPNPMDGVAGVTQNGVRPGETFTYEFDAKVPGTYWYHSHQDGVNQVDRGLYGTLIVEPKEEKVKYDKEFVLVLDEWAPDMIGEDGHVGGNHNHAAMMNGGAGQAATPPAAAPAGGGNNMSGMSGMDHSKHMMAGMSHDQMMQQMYNVYTVNGKAGDSIAPLVVDKGDRVKLRIINAGMLAHNLHLQGQKFRITHTDGQELPNGPDLVDKALPIGPAERYDLEFVADGTPFMIDTHDGTPGSKDFRIPVVYSDNKTPVDREAGQSIGLPLIDLTKYAAAQPVGDPITTQFDLVHKFVLGSQKVTKDGVEQEMYTLNGKMYPETDTISVQKGQKVKFILSNPDTNDHPMHLHGHFFQLVSKNGEPIAGPPILKDTVLIKPQEEYEIAFVADNDGIWMLHCHELHHAASGMMSHIEYAGYKPTFTPDPTVGNKPE